ncbi:MAG: hypothetical protein RMY34_30055 [Aulosira sp. DedQUE10]|nr:hypothetical protein [Aulosira sp. DedQUE10]
MSLIDGILLTLVNTVICLAFPKLLSIISAAKTKTTEPSTAVITISEASPEIPSFL